MSGELSHQRAEKSDQAESVDGLMAPFVVIHALDQRDLTRYGKQGVKWLAFPGSVSRMLRSYEEDGDGPVLMSSVDLQPAALLAGYAEGCFPYPNQLLPAISQNEGTEYWWHRPNPRTLFLPDSYTQSRSLRQSLRTYDITVNQAFDYCAKSCANKARASTEGHSSKPWINNDILDSYHELNRQGAAFSIEARERSSGVIVGGLFGIRIGKYVTVESMFREEKGTSKPAFAALLAIALREDLPFVDVQLPAPHWERWGATPVRNDEFMSRLGAAVSGSPLDWQPYEASTQPFDTKPV